MISERTTVAIDLPGELLQLEAVALSMNENVFAKSVRVSFNDNPEILN